MCWAGTPNVGYVCFESDTNIVAGVSRVFLLFFFLLAALVCITTMTRMVEEQRTQLGVLMAMGYGRGPSCSSTFLLRQRFAAGVRHRLCGRVLHLSQDPLARL